MPLPMSLHKAGDTIAEYRIVEEIGRGSFAVVYKAVRISDGETVAIKEISLDKLNHNEREHLRKEPQVLKQVDSPNIIKLYDFMELNKVIYLITEYCDGGDLHEYLGRQPGYRLTDIDAIRSIVMQLANGLIVLNEKGIAHRDLKPHNLLLSGNPSGKPSIKIADFGFAKEMPSFEKYDMMKTMCGTPLYMAPEMRSGGKYNSKVDLWSVGCILLQLVTGQPPALTPSTNGPSYDIKIDYALSTVKWDPECLDLCRKLLEINPLNRITFKEFISHSFLYKNVPVQGVEKLKFKTSLPGDVLVNGDPKEEVLDLQKSRMKSNLGPLRTTSSDVKKNDLCKKDGTLDSIDLKIINDYVVVDNTRGLVHDHVHKHSKGRPPRSDQAKGSSGSGRPVACPTSYSQRASRNSTKTEDSGYWLPVLRDSAKHVGEIARKQLESKRVQEAFSVQMVCVSLLQEAMSLCKRENVPVPVEVQQQFKEASEFKAYLVAWTLYMKPSVSHRLAATVIYKSARQDALLGTESERRGDPSTASTRYARALVLLHLLFMDRSPICINSPITVDKQRLDRPHLYTYFNDVKNRRAACHLQMETMANRQPRYTSFNDRDCNSQMENMANRKELYHQKSHLVV